MFFITKKIKISKDFYNFTLKHFELLFLMCNHYFVYVNCVFVVVDFCVFVHAQCSLM